MKFITLIVLFAFQLSYVTDLMAQGDTNPNTALNAKQQSIVTIASLTAQGDTERLKPALSAGLDAGLTINEIKEVMVHLYVYGGFPRSLRGLTTFMDVLEDREAQGIEDKAGDAAPPRLNDEYEYLRGERILDAITAGWSPTEPQDGYPAFAPIIEQFLREHLFANIFSRDILSYLERELVTISTLASMEGVEPYLQSHLGVGMNVGLTESQLRGILSIIESTAGEAKAGEARDLLTQVLASQADTTEDASTRAQNSSESADKGHSDLQKRITLFPRGDRRAASENFTGAVWVDMVVTDAETYDTRIGNVTFEPGSRTDWHKHPGGQILLVTGGSGYYQERGEPIQLMRKGDIVKIEPGVEHWHGALPESELTHVAVVTNDSKGGTIWLEPVTDQEYYSTW